MAQINLSHIFTLKVNLLEGRGNQTIRVAQILAIYHSYFLLHLYLIIILPPPYPSILQHQQHECFAPFPSIQALVISLYCKSDRMWDKGGDGFKGL